MVWRLSILSFGIFCAATSVVMTKASTLQPEHLSASRLLVAVFILLPLFLRDKKRFPDYSLATAFKISGVPALLLAIHFITWTIGARWTTAANSTLIVNLMPIAMPLVGFFILKETMNGKEWIGTSLVFLGVVVMGVSDFRVSVAHFWGDLVCVLSMLLLAWYLILARKNKWVPSIWLYLVPLYFSASVLCFAMGLARVGLPHSDSNHEWMYILLLGLVPTVLGHSLLNLAMRWFRSQLVALLNQMAFVYAGILGFFFFNEIPNTPFYFASTCMLAGVLWTILAPSPTKHEQSHPIE
ncbi:MAG: DMT family transporter [Verrucomicrobia bacterium]|nr:DMT family transporter [Verrucomicrobiota bacterium]MDA1068506.1 DMT family transporter [Verrucomicrobiota bacterium]